VGAIGKGMSATGSTGNKCAVNKVLAAGRPGIEFWLQAPVSIRNRVLPGNCLEFNRSGEVSSRNVLCCKKDGDANLLAQIDTLQNPSNSFAV
jgi:hypothetical protein